jgi:hypothetical protein
MTEYLTEKQANGIEHKCRTCSYFCVSDGRRFGDRPGDCFIDFIVKRTDEENTCDWWIEPHYAQYRINELEAEVRRLLEENKKLDDALWNGEPHTGRDTLDLLEDDALRTEALRIKKENERLLEENKRLDNELQGWELQFPSKRKRLTSEKIDELVERIKESERPIAERSRAWIDDDPYENHGCPG